MEHVKIVIAFKFINEIDRNLQLRMGKGTKVAIFTLRGFVGITCAKLCLIFIRVIELFHTVVCKRASISLWTLLLFQDKLAHFTSICSKFPASVFCLIVEKGTSLLIVITLTILMTFWCFKKGQVQEHTTFFTLQRVQLTSALIGLFRWLSFPVCIVILYLNWIAFLLPSLTCSTSPWCINNCINLDFRMFLVLSTFDILLNSCCSLFLLNWFLLLLLFAFLNFRLLCYQVKVTTFIWFIFMEVRTLKCFAIIACKLANTCSKW